MPAIRPKLVVDDKYESQSSYTIDLDLPSAGKISQIWLSVKAQQETSGLGSSPFMKHLISSISVNQGGQSFLCSAPPEAFQADYYYKTGKFPQIGKQVMEDASESVEEIIPIMFGRKVNDPEFYIDLAKMNDPKVSVTYNLATTDCWGQTTWETGYYPRFSVRLDLMSGPDMIPSKGYHSLRQYEKYTPVNSEKRLVELKTGRPIRAVYLQFDKLAATYGMIHSVNNVKVYGENEAWVPFDLNIHDYEQIIREYFGLCTARGFVPYVWYGYNMDMIVDRRLALSFPQSETEMEFPRIVGGAGRQGPLKRFDELGGSSSSSYINAYFEFIGLAPWSIYPIDVEKFMGIPSLDTGPHAPVYLEIEHVSNAATIGGPFKVHILDIAPPL